ncbi:MAG: hypothetical protein QOC77_2280 [Thermoleophilaceae bacterium]|jgi:hypothetical protein|nr:hypothetical protein [Thermoleophilaceae bacterium]
MAQVWKRELRWSTPVEDVVRQVVADQGVACWVEPKGLVRTRPRVHLMLLPLKDVAVPGLDQEPVPGATRDHWLVWQSLTRAAHPTLLPTDPGRLIDALGVRDAKGGDMVAAALGQLMASLYESRSV